MATANLPIGGTENQINEFVCARRDSNPYRWYRKPQFYPLNYGRKKDKRTKYFTLPLSAGAYFGLQIYAFVLNCKHVLHVYS